MFNSTTNLVKNHWKRQKFTLIFDVIRGCFFPPSQSHSGYRISYQRIRQSLLRIDPIHRVFDRIRIRRCVYSVPGPNALWHHVGQHGKPSFVYYNITIVQYDLGLIPWGIVIHGFIDGYSRLITALQASDNNMGKTVLDLFLRAAAIYGVPSRLRGDQVWKIYRLPHDFRRTQCGSYIWG